MFDYSGNAICTKVKAMYGNRLTKQDYDEMLHMQSVSEVAAYLKATPSFHSQLADIQEELIHRGQLESLLKRDTFEKYARLLHYETGKDSFFRYYVMSLETIELSRCIHLIHLGRSEEFIAGAPTYVQAYFSFDLIKLAKVRDYSELLQLLQGTPYYAVLTVYLSPKDHPLDLPACESALEGFYYDRVFKMVDKFYKGKTNRDLKTLIKTKKELYNISIIYRMKKFFSAPPQEITRHLLTGHVRVSRVLFDDLIHAETAEETLRLLSDSHYSKFIEQDFVFIEYTTQHIIYHLGKRFITFSSSAPTVLAAYMTLRQIEIENVINIIEGIRYNMLPMEIEQLLIL